MKLESTKHADGYIANTMMMTGMLYSREGATPRFEVDHIVEILARDHEAALDELDLETPDLGDNNAEVFGVVECLLCKYSRKALNAWMIEQAS